MMIRVSTTSQSGQDMDEYNELEKRKRTEGKHNLVDRINLLAFEVLVNMVSLLSLKEAAATSILSKRWHNLWKHIMTLNFQYVDFAVGDNFRCFEDLEQKLTDQKSREYVDWVDRVLEQHEGQNIERFRAFFFLNRMFKSSTDKWIELAMKKRVQVLELQFLVKQYDHTDDNYTFPQNLVGLRYNIGFKYLKLLRLQGIGVSDEILDYFLFNCPVLERLTLVAVNNLVRVRAVGPLISLKYLSVNDCPNLKSIQICDASIVSFVYRGILIDLHISKVPLMIEVHISERALDKIDFTTLAFQQLRCCLYQIEILKLNLCGVVYDLEYAFPILENLKHLELNVETDYHSSLYHICSFMKACPYIQKLVLKLDFRTDVETTPSKGTKFSHQSLKVLEILGYRGRRCAVEHVVYLIENAVALEEVIIEPVRRWIWPPGMDRGTKAVEDEVKAREHAKKHLKERVPSNIEFVSL